MDYAITDKDHWHKLVRYISHRFHSADAEDLLQTAYLRLCERRSKNAIVNFDAFLVRTAINAGIDQRRREKYRDTTVAANDLEAVRDDAPTQDAVFSDRQRLAQLRDILNAMKPRTREILLMHRLDGMTYKQISRKQGITQSAVEKQIAKGVQQLVVAMGDV